MLRRTLLALLVATLAGTALAQAPAPDPTPEAAAGLALDATQTRDALRELLRKHPSEVGVVIAMSPNLLGNAAYMASYPGLQTFVAQHPEIAANPGYFFEGYHGWSVDTRPDMLRFLEDFLAGLAAIAACVTGLIVLVWLIRTILDQRRWRHLARVQADVHQKVLDRMASNEQLLAYLESPAGRRLMESTPIPMEARQTHPPVGRVLWPMQAGLVLLAGGIGLLVVSRQLPAEADLVIRVMGVAIVSLGIGFIVSSLASYYLSRRLGLWQDPQPALKDS
jgi:hypothetical protein